MPDYRAIARKDALKYGLDPGIFLRQISQESGFRTDARSSAGAIGIAQFMPGTAAGFHIDPRNPIAALDAAARMDAGNLKKYGSYERMLSAYNSGRADAYKDPNFAKGQTYNYVRSIMGGKGMGKGFTPGSTNFPDSSGSAGGDNQGLVNYLLRASQALSAGTEMPSLTDVMAHGFEGNATSTPGTSLPGAIGKAKRGALAELLHEGTGGPTHSTGDHIHAAFNDPQAMLAAIRQAQAMGLSTRENPYVETVDPVHAKNSYHYRTFGGLYNGRKLGQAIDVSGPKSMDFYNWVNSRYGR